MARASGKTGNTESGSDDRGAKKTAAKKSTAKKSSSSTKRAATKSAERSGSQRSTKVPAMKVARSAAQQLVALTGRQAESVIGIQRAEDGWQVDLEVVESRRIPDSTDILATYQVQTNEGGDLTEYHRVRRYIRGKGGDEGAGR